MSFFSWINSPFEGAWSTKDRATNHLQAPRDADEDLTSLTRRELIKRSRAMFKNSGVVRAPIIDNATYSVGFAMKGQACTGDPEIDKAYNDYFTQWADSCDITGKYNLGELAFLWCQAIDVDGDCFLLTILNENSPPKIQTLESHQVGDTKDFQSDEKYKNGVRKNKLGRPVSYQLSSGRKVPAWKTIHLYDVSRVGQTRGIPAFAHALNSLRDIKEILDHEKKGVKLNSLLTFFVKKMKPGGKPGDNFKERKEAREGGASKEELSSLAKKVDLDMVNYLNPGEDVHAHSGNRPSPTFQGFIDFFIRDYTQGMGLPYEFSWNSEKAGGAGHRAVIAKANRTFKRRQKLIIKKALEPIWKLVIADAISKNILPFHEDFEKSKWWGPPDVTVDAGRESKEIRENLKMGLTNLQRIYAEQGEDYLEPLRQRALEVKEIQDLADELGVSPELICQRTPNMNEIKNENENES